MNNSTSEVVFEEKPEGKKLDTSKEDKKLDVFRATKEKFKQARKQEALEFNLIDQHRNEPKPEEDLDSLIQELEDKGKKKNKEKLPFITTK